MDQRIEAARLSYERAVFGGDAAVLPTAEQELDAVEADLALARGRIVHAAILSGSSDGDREGARELELFERAVALYRALGDERGEGEALFWLGTFHQVIHNDNKSAVPLLTQSLALASGVQDRLTMSYALRHLGIGNHFDGQLAEARGQLEESTRLRRDLGFSAGVAANLVGLAYLASAQGRQEDARSFIDEAHELAQASGAHAILDQVQEARGHLTSDAGPSV